MKKTVHYKIAEPCHENWGAMTPIEKGRFCNSCAKPVVDFTKMADHQVVSYLSAATDSVCGRMTIRQLDRDFTLYHAEQTRSFNLRALVLGTALSTFSALNVYSQGEFVKGKMAVQVEEPVKMGEMERVFPVKAAVTGSVFSGNTFDYYESAFVSGVEVTIYDEAGNQLATTLSNDSGRFELPLNTAQNPYSAVFRKEEYMERVYLFADLLTTTDITVDFSAEMRMMLGMIIRD